MPGTAARDRAEGRIEGVRDLGGVFVEAVRATRLPMVLTDPGLPGDPIVFANQAFLDLSGYAMEDVLGQEAHFMNGPDTDPEDAARFVDILAADTDGLVETIQYAKDGRRFVASVLLSAFKDEQGRTLHHFLTWTDVTRRVDAEMESLALRKAQVELAEGEERQAFLLKLSDALRPLADAAAIQATTSRLLGEYLGLDRSMFGEVEGDPGAETGTIRGQYVRPPRAGEAPIEPFPPTFSFESYGEDVMAGRRRGDLLVVDDIASAPGFTQVERDAWIAAGVRAAIVAPLVKEGRLVAEFGAHSAAPRVWTDAEKSLVRDVAERTWAAAERARAEAAQRKSEEKYAVLFAASPAPVLILTPDPPDFTIADVNAAYLAATNRTRDDLVGRPMFEAFPDDPDDPAATGVRNLRASFERALVSRRVEPMDVQKYAIAGPDGTFEQRWWKPVNAPVVDRSGEVVAIIHHVADVTAEHRAGEAVRESRERLRLIVENARDYAIFTMDLDGIVTDWREGAEAIFGYTHDEIVGRSGDILFTPEDIAAREPHKERELAAKTGAAPNVRWHVCRNRERVFIEGVNTALHDAEGNLRGYLKVGRDATDRHQAERRQQLLLAELQHRVRNILAMVRSMVRQSDGRYDDLDEFVAHLVGRLDAMARTQVLLTRATGARVDLETLVRDEFETHIVDERRLKIGGPAVSLAPKAAEVLTLALHELATNSLKYGALSDPDGRLAVEWSLPSKVEGPWLQLSWQEVCRRAMPQDITPGFGTELIEERVPYELKGEASLLVTANGVRAEIAFPLTDGMSILETGFTAGP